MTLMRNVSGILGCLVRISVSTSFFYTHYRLSTDHETD
nr:MAG TPA: hypothetical protein [Caudoviricetes sp.]